MAKKKRLKTYSYDESLEMLAKLQQMAIDEGNLSLALKAEELKCKIAAMQEKNFDEANNDDLTKVLVDFINERKTGTDSADICPAD